MLAFGLCCLKCDPVYPHYVFFNTMMLHYYVALCCMHALQLRFILFFLVLRALPISVFFQSVMFSYHLALFSS